MVESEDKYTFVNLDAEARRRENQSTFHFLSERGLRGQILKLEAGTRHRMTASDSAIVAIGIEGTVQIEACGRLFDLCPLAQLFLAPDVEHSLYAPTRAAYALFSIPLPSA